MRDEQETNTKPETLGELHAPAPPDPQCQEAADGNEAEEAQDGVKRANALRNKEYLGMMKMARQIKRRVLNGPTLRMPAPTIQSGGSRQKAL